MKYKKDPELEKMLPGKRVVLVAPSKHLTGKRCGHTIDKYDVVCRVGEFYPYDAEVDYGSRTDIFVGALNDQTPPLMKKEFKMAQKRGIDLNQIKCAICPQFSRDVHTDNSILENFYKMNELSGMPLHHIGDKYFLQLKKEVGAPPNTGLIIIPVLLNYDLAELFITGHSFYQDSKHSDCCYRKGYAGRTGPNAGGGHKHEAQVAYFRKLLSQYPEIIKVDSYLNNLLKLRHNNVFHLRKK